MKPLFPVVIILVSFGLLLPLQVLAQSSSRTFKSAMRPIGLGGTLVDAAVTYSQSEGVATPAAANTWQTSTSIVDFKIGYIDEGHTYWGAIYSARGDTQFSTSSNSGSSAGLGVGHFGPNGFNVRAFYKFNEVYGNYQQGSGFQLDAGYALNLAATFYLGLNLSYRDITFKSNPTIASFQPWDRKELYPFITMGFLIY